MLAFFFTWHSAFSASKTLSEAWEAGVSQSSFKALTSADLWWTRSQQSSGL